ncbi:MAG TPA: hypothetical protein VGD77_06740 [Gemmatimonadaceae bacterium]
MLVYDARLQELSEYTTAGQMRRVSELPDEIRIDDLAYLGADSVALIGVDSLGQFVARAPLTPMLLSTC